MATSSDKTSMIKTSLTTLAQAGLGTLALVGAHHLGRRQYNADARLSDYSDGVREAYQSLLRQSKQGSNTSGKGEPSSKAYRPITKIQPSPQWISGVADLQTNEFGVVGINEACEILWQTSMPERVHDILIQLSPPKSNLSEFSMNDTIPTDSLSVQNESSADNVKVGTLFTSKYFKPSVHVAVMGRRPSEYFWILDSKTGDILQTIKADADRHFYGHACYSLDGNTLYVTENNTATFDGIIGVYEVCTDNQILDNKKAGYKETQYKKTGEFAAQGIGPHEIAIHPDGDTLVIANGGIKTERASRDELNLDSMQPSLVYLNRRTGEVLQTVSPEHNQMSVRHLSIHKNGTVAIGIQFQGERHLEVPLVLTHRRGDAEFTALTLKEDDSKGWHRFHHYIASVALDSASNLLCATSPLGGCAVVFDLTTNEMIGEVDLPDCAGVAVWHDGIVDKRSLTSFSPSLPFSFLPSFLVSDGQGYLTRLSVDINNSSSKISINQLKQPFAFDNHLQPLP